MKGCVMTTRAAKKAQAPEVDSSDLLSIEVELPAAGGGVETRTLRFKSWTHIPIGIIRQTRHDFTAQMWAAFEWSIAAGDLAVFDELPASKLLDIKAQMQEASNADLGESQASST